MSEALTSKPTKYKLTEKEQGYIAAINKQANNLISLYVTDILIDKANIKVTESTQFKLEADGTIEVIDGKGTAEPSTNS